MQKNNRFSATKEGIKRGPTVGLLQLEQPPHAVRRVHDARLPGDGEGGQVLEHVAGTIGAPGGAPRGAPDARHLLEVVERALRLGAGARRPAAGAPRRHASGALTTLASSRLRGAEPHTCNAQSYAQSLVANNNY